MPSCLVLRAREGFSLLPFLVCLRTQHLWASLFISLEVSECEKKVVPAACASGVKSWVFEAEMKD